MAMHKRFLIQVIGGANNPNVITTVASRDSQSHAEQVARNVSLDTGAQVIVTDSEPSIRSRIGRMTHGRTRR